MGDKNSEAQVKDVKDAKLLEVLIIDPDKIIYEGQATKVFAPGPYGEVAFLPHHAPLYSELSSGKVSIEESGGKLVTKEIEGGVVRIKNNTIKILVGF